jgi:hypothetical protein
LLKTSTGADCGQKPRNSLGFSRRSKKLSVELLNGGIRAMSDWLAVGVSQELEITKLFSQGSHLTRLGALVAKGVIGGPAR